VSDLKEYIDKRSAKDDVFMENWVEGYESFRVGVLLKQLRLETGLTQEALAERLGTRKPAISRIENHAEDIRLSTLERFAKALGKELVVTIR
jgi:DNA-binding XRE family transcriptional regulator